MEFLRRLLGKREVSADDRARALFETYKRLGVSDEVREKAVSILPETFDPLVSELVEIGESTVMEGGRSHFFVPKGQGVGPYTSWHPRVREIGAELHKMGNGMLDLMREAHRIVSQRMGAAPASDLSANWHNIGDQEWQAGKGECWMH